MRRAARTAFASIALGGALLGSSGGAFGLELPRENAVPGGIKILRLDSTTASTPYVEAGGHHALVVQDGSTWVAVIGIPLSAPLGMRQVSVRDPNGTQELEFTVGDKQYTTQSLKVAPRQVNPSAADLARINREKIRIDHALSHWTEAPPESLRLAAAGARPAQQLIRLA